MVSHGFVIARKVLVKLQEQEGILSKFVYNNKYTIIEKNTKHFFSLPDREVYEYVYTNSHGSVLKVWFFMRDGEIVIHYVTLFVNLEE